ncbi:MAG: hypothetical protein R3F14_33705 [Polyangiaceae bacterium]
MSRLLRHLLFLFSLAAVAGLARDARADAATAQALFDQGKKLMGEKNYKEACPKFEESQRLDPGLGTQTNLAICYAAVGRTASAWSLYLEVAAQAKATNQSEREKKARDAAKELEPKLSKLTIQVTSPPEGIEVKRNDQLVAEPTWGTPVPVDPGEIHITAMAPNHKLWETTLTINKPGETTVTVPELEEGETPQGYGGAGPAPTGTVTGYYGSQPPGLPPGLPPAPRMKRRSSGMFGGGIAMICVGSLSTLGGLAWLVFAEGRLPAGVTVFGLALLGGGIALTVIGGKKVPVEQPAKTGKAQLLPVSPIPEVRIGLGAAQATWEF